MLSIVVGMNRNPVRNGAHDLGRNLAKGRLRLMPASAIKAAAIRLGRRRRTVDAVDGFVIVPALCGAAPALNILVVFELFDLRHYVLPSISSRCLVAARKQQSEPNFRGHLSTATRYSDRCPPAPDPFGIAAARVPDR